MKKEITLPLIATLLFLLSCQSLLPTARDGTVIANCGDIVAAVDNLQPEDIPPHLFETGSKRGDEFDVNEYFKVLTHIAMQDGYRLDYVYQSDFLGAFPSIYARPEEREPYTSMKDVPANLQHSDFREYIEVEDLEQGYFEYVVLTIMANQFYLDWHANYNDTRIVCTRNDVNAIVASAGSGGFGMEMDRAQQAKARAMKGIEPAVQLTESNAIIEVITFTKWGGFYRQTYTISRSFPHTIIDVKEENLVPYDCGIVF